MYFEISILFYRRVKDYLFKNNFKNKFKNKKKTYCEEEIYNKRVKRI